jgi:hypothetical protein
MPVTAPLPIYHFEQRSPLPFGVAGFRYLLAPRAPHSALTLGYR